MGGATGESVAAGSFGQRLRALRAASGLTQEELAERSGLSPNGISALERGTRTSPYPHTVRALADALDLDEASRAEVLALARGARADSADAAEVSTTPGPVAGLGTPTTALLGRDSDVAEIGALLSGAARLVTLTGPGGVGKTRLAAAAADSSRDAFDDGVVFVALSAVTQLAEVAPAMADAVGLPTAESPFDALAEHLRDRQLLLVLDNLEQVLAAGQVIVDLLAACPSVTVLATSRAPLNVRGEVERPVRPLSLPSTQAIRADAVLSAPAGRLFVERAQAVVPEFAVTDADAAAVAAICWRLGGLPLAIELAAPRVRLLDPATLLNRLDQALAVGWARDLPTRQQTIQATLDWSHDLLEPQEQQLLALLGVFVGGFDLVAVEAVAVGDLDEDDVLPALEALVQQSLVTVKRTPGAAPSYSLLEPIREYALGRLRARDELESVVRRRHRAHFLALAEQAATEFAGPQQVVWLQRAEWERTNFRAAIVNALDEDDGETAGRLCWAMWIAWWMSGHLREGRAFAVEVLRHPLPDWVRVRNLLVVACMSYAQGDVDVARRSWQDALDVAIEAGDELGRAYATAGVGLCDLATGQLDAAKAQFLPAISLAEQCGEEWLLSLCRIWIGTALLASGDHAGAIEHAERGLANARARGDRLVIYVALFNLAEAAIALGELDRAAVLLREGIALSVETGDRANLAFYLDALAVVAVSREEMKHASRLFGAAEAMRQSAGAVVYKYYLPDEARRSAAVEAARSALGDEAYDSLFAEGCAVDMHGAADLAV